MEAVKENKPARRQNAAYPFVFVAQKRSFTGKMEMQQQVNPGITERLYVATEIYSRMVAYDPKADYAECAAKSIKAADQLIDLCQETE